MRTSKLCAAVALATLSATAFATSLTGAVDAIVTSAYSSAYSCLVLSGKPYACWQNQGRYDDMDYQYSSGSAFPPTMPAFQGIRSIEFGAWQYCVWDATGIQCADSKNNWNSPKLVVPASAGIRSLEWRKSDWGNTEAAQEPSDGYNGSTRDYAPPQEHFCATTDTQGQICWSGADSAPFAWPAPFPQPEQVVVTWNTRTIQVPSHYKGEEPITARLHEAVTCALNDGEVLCEADPSLSIPAPGSHNFQYAPDFKVAKRLLPVPPLGPVSALRTAHFAVSTKSYYPSYLSHICATTSTGETCWSYLNAPDQDRYVVNPAPKSSQDPTYGGAKIDVAGAAKFLDGWLSSVTKPIDALAQVIYQTKSKPFSQLSAYITALPAAKSFSPTDSRVGAILWLLNAWTPAIDGLNAHDAAQSVKSIQDYRARYDGIFGVKALTDIGLPEQRPEVRSAADFTLGAALDSLSANVAQTEARAALQKLAADFAAASAQPAVTHDDLLGRLAPFKPLLTDLTTVGRAKGLALTAVAAAAYLEAK